MATGKVNKGRESEQENMLRELSMRLKGAGYEVRRERLKAGHGWQAVSGKCRSRDSRMVFVDSRLPRYDQIQFLRSKLAELGLDDVVLTT